METRPYKEKPIQRILTGVLFLLIPLYSAAQDEKDGMVIIYGDKFIFTVEYPEGWVYNPAKARNKGVKSYFHPSVEQDNKSGSFMFAHGQDKKEGQNLSQFVMADYEKYKYKYPDFKVDSVTTGATGPISRSIMLRFYDLPDIYREEVFYMEAEESIIILSFTAVAKEDYTNYHPLFDSFISSFLYRGNKPQRMLEHLKNN